MDISKTLYILFTCILLIADPILGQNNNTSIDASSVTTNPSSDKSTEADTSSKQASTGTTVPPSEATEAEKKSNEPDEKSTTTQVPSTTTEKPPEYTWEVFTNDENRTVCLKLSVEMTFTNPNDSGHPIKIPTEAKVDQANSNCGNENQTTQTMTLVYVNGTKQVVTFEFKKQEVDKETPKYYLSLLTYLNATGLYTLNGTGDIWTGHVDKSFKCNTEEAKKLPDDFTFTWKNVQVQAFMTPNSAGKFGSVEECGADNTSDVVPIAVGCALAGLVVVVLIAYVVGRRRSRQKGYQSV